MKRHPKAQNNAIMRTALPLLLLGRYSTKSVYDYKNKDICKTSLKSFFIIHWFYELVTELTEKLTWGTAPINTPTKNLKAKIQPNEGDAEDSVPYQNKNKVAHTSVGFLPNLSATIPQEGAPSIIPE